MAGPGQKYVYEFPGVHVKSGFEERPDYFSSVAFWYQKGRAKRFAELPPAPERLKLAARIEGEALLERTECDPAGELQEQKGGGYSGGSSSSSSSWSSSNSRSSSSSRSSSRSSSSSAGRSSSSRRSGGGGRRGFG